MSAAPAPLLTRKAVVFAKIETTYNTDAIPTQSSDAILVEEPDYTSDPEILERKFTRNSLSRLPHRVGRILAGMTFMVEAGSNGKANAATEEPVIGRLLRACGFSSVAMPAGVGTVDSVNAKDANDSLPEDVTWSIGSGDNPTEPILYTLELTAANQVSITPDKNAVDSGYDAVQTGVAFATGTAIQLKDAGGGASITPTIVNAPTVGDKWTVWVFPEGFMYRPVSGGFESVTLYMYKDGTLHKMPGARGTFTLEAKAGNYGKFSFTFTGQYVKSVDSPLPASPKYRQLDPPIFEKAHLSVDEYPAVIETLNIDLATTVSVRPDANSPDGYCGVRITDRDVSGGIDPEATLVADHDFWDRLEKATQMVLRARIGETVGNRIWTLAPSVQYTGLTYQDRESMLVYDAGLAFNGVRGDDELTFCFA